MRWKPETPEQKVARLESQLRKQGDDRARRIRELVREWVGRGKWQGQATLERLVALAACYIDAIDAAEIPPRESGEVSRG